jgi:retron-type reverse transcriptase
MACDTARQLLQWNKASQPLAAWVITADAAVGDNREQCNLFLI